METEGARRDGGTAGVLSQTAIDPGLEERDLIGRQRVVFGRHPFRGVFGGDDLNDPAGTRPSRHHNRAAGAPFHDGREAGEVEARFLFRFAMALLTMTLEERRDVVVVRDRLVRRARVRDVPGQEQPHEGQRQRKRATIANFRRFHQRGEPQWLNPNSDELRRLHRMSS